MMSVRACASAGFGRLGTMLCPVLMAAFVAACGGGDDNGGDKSSADGTVGVSVYPVGAADYSSSRIYVPVTAVGSPLAGALPLVLDTGSAGVTLNALKLFPADMVTTTGFVFPAGQDSLSHGGMTVTKLKVFKSFGSANGGTAQIGNLGFAALRFGAQGEAATANTPVLFYYAIQSTTNGHPNGNAVSPPIHQGVFGINSSANAVHVAGAIAPTTLSVCSPQSTESCHLLSPLRYLKYPEGIDAGFSLSPVSLQNCDIRIPGSCTPAPVFTVGLTNGAASDYFTQPLACPGLAPQGHFNGLPICESNVRATIASGGASYSGKVQFDTGTPAEVIHVHPGIEGFASPPAPGTPFSISPAAGFTYSFRAGVGTTATSVVLNSSERSVVGIDFFTTHALFINYTRTTEGWR